MKAQENRLKIVMFSGGRGTGAISEALLKNPNLDLTLLVNAYDDGLSTGLLRRFIPGMLGPSDIRKNVSRFLKQKEDPSSQALHFLLECRLPDPIETEEAIGIIKDLINFKDTATSDNEITKKREDISLSQMRMVSCYLETFLNYYENRIKEFPDFSFGDVSLGNLLFAGCYLANKNDFNRSIEDFSGFTKIGDRVLNVTKGENRVIVGIKENGKFLHDEATVVGPQDSSRIEEIFLLPDYLDQKANPIGSYKIDNIRLLRSIEMLPDINSIADNAIRNADIIIYGPGTQYSSLFPSYLTSGVAEAITANTKAEKVFIANIARDYDILGEDATSLVNAFLLNMGRKIEGSVACQDVVTRFFFQKPEKDASEDVPYMKFDASRFKYPLEKVRWIDLEGESGKHLGSRTVSELLIIVEDQLKKRIAHVSQKISIIVPALNEEKTIKQVLQDLQALQFSELKLEKEIIVIDGGSSDKTFELASSVSGARAYRLSKKGGRGEALQFGLDKAKGDIIVFFPSDGEYSTQDIKRIVSPLVNQEFPVVFGSRAFRTNDLSETLERIYGKKGALYAISKYGGVLLSIMTLVLYQKFISDPFTSIKGFNSRIFRNMHFSCKGVDFDMELVARIAKADHIILEVPVSYKARTVKEGKKTTVLDGMKCLWAVIRFSFLKSGRIKEHAFKKVAETKINES